jgi:hypothetical protein
LDQESVRIVVGCDTDPDRLDFGGIPFDRGSERQIWRGVDCIRGMRDRLDTIRDESGRPVAVTWFLRCDEQIRATEGAASALVSSRRDLWRHCADAGDEIAWHPHFWRLADDGRTWFHETEDLGFQEAMLRDAHSGFTEAWGSPPRSVRMGWDYHSNVSMATLADLGVGIDLSALPRQSFAGAHDDRGASFAGCFEWSVTGTRPYRPSRSDYRLPGSGTEALDIVELPQSLLTSRFVGLLGEARGAVRDRSIARLVRAFGPGAVSHSTVKACAPPPLFRWMVRDVLRRGEDWIVTYFHPDELLPRKGNLINDFLHRADSFLANMRTALALVRASGRTARFVTAGEAADLLRR